MLNVLITPCSALDQMSTRAPFNAVARFNTVGVYVLLGADAGETGHSVVQVAASNHVATDVIHRAFRTQRWHTAALFVGKYRSLDGAHAHWLATQLTTLAAQQQRARVISEHHEGNHRLSNDEVALLQPALTQVRTVLTTMGFDVLGTPQTVLLPEGDPPERLTARAVPSPTVFSYSGEGFAATMEARPRGFVVHAGSLARVGEAPSLQPTYRALRAHLRARGLLVETPAGLRFIGDHVFKSASAAACVASGTTVGGGTSWKLASGVSFAEWDTRRE